MKPFLLILTLATVCFAASEFQISKKVMLGVEGAINDKFRTGMTDPYDLLGTARGTYLNGYGALITVELELVYVNPPSAFRPAYTPQEIAAMRERKLKKLPVLKETMRNLLVSASASMDALPPTEQIAVEAILWHYNWEDSRGIPQRLLMTAQKEKLLRAQAAHADLSTVIEELEQ